MVATTFTLMFGVYPEVSIEVVLSIESLITAWPGAHKWSLTGVGLKMSLEMIVVVEPFSTVRIVALEGLKAGVGFGVPIQVVRVGKHFGTHVALEYFAIFAGC